jgi:hypothetical protein
MNQHKRFCNVLKQFSKQRNFLPQILRIWASNNPILSDAVHNKDFFLNLVVMSFANKNNKDY